MFLTSVNTRYALLHGFSFQSALDTIGFRPVYIHFVVEQEVVPYSMVCVFAAVFSELPGFQNALGSKSLHNMSNLALWDPG